MKKILLILILILVLSLLVKFPPSISVGGFSISINGTITKYTGLDSYVVIPSRIGIIPVRTIGDRAFIEKGLISVDIPSKVTLIDHFAVIS